MRTLVISDLHIGAGRGRTTLDDPAVVERLAEAIATVDRLVLLGDIIELRERPLSDALAAASRVLPELVRGMASGREVIMLMGNHDHQLQVHAEALSQVEWMLSQHGASVRFEYPGLWLRDDVYAHHGHYLDRHTTTPAFERIAAGAMARFIRLPLAQMSEWRDYERLQSPIYAWMFAISQNGDGEVDSAEGGGSSRLLKRMRHARPVEKFALETGVRALVAAVGRFGRLGPLTGDVSDAQLRRASLEAYGDVLSVLGLRPAYALFGHTHRAGPLRGDVAGEWRRDGVQLLNTGCWVNEHFTTEHAGENPYRPGFAVELDLDGPPRLVNLLER